MTATPPFSSIEVVSTDKVTLGGSLSVIEKAMLSPEATPEPLSIDRVR